MQRIGLISDTHGLLRPEALCFLQGCDRIVHAGDIGDLALLDALADIAPLVVVRGNNDRGDRADALETACTLRIEGVTIHVIHDIADLRDCPPPADARVVIHGHSHKPGTIERDGVLYVNPGSAGPRRFKLSISIGELRIDGTEFTLRLVDLVS